jgi:hypothetical protein
MLGFDLLSLKLFHKKSSSNNDKLFKIKYQFFY